MSSIVENVSTYCKRKFKKSKHYLKSAFKLFNSNGIGLLPANIAFFSLWSMVPIIMLWDIVSKAVPVLSENEFIDPEVIAQNTSSFVNSGPFDFTISIDGILFALVILYLSSKPFKSIIRSSNYIYGFEGHDNIIKVNIKSVLYALLIVVTFVLLLIISVLGDEIIKLLSTYVDDNKILDVVSWLRLPGTFLYLTTVIFVIYYLAPSVRMPIKYFLPGTFFCVSGWLLITKIYSFYIAEIADYQKIYSGVSNLIILIIWLYLISYILILGLVLNAAYYGENHDIE